MGHGLQCLTPVCIACGPYALVGVGRSWLSNKQKTLGHRDLQLSLFKIGDPPLSLKKPGPTVVPETTGTQG